MLNKDRVNYTSFDGSNITAQDLFKNIEDRLNGLGNAINILHFKNYSWSNASFSHLFNILEGRPEITHLKLSNTGLENLEDGVPKFPTTVKRLMIDNFSVHVNFLDSLHNAFKVGTITNASLKFSSVFVPNNNSKPRIIIEFLNAMLSSSSLKQLHLQLTYPSILNRDNIEFVIKQYEQNFKTKTYTISVDVFNTDINIKFER